MHNRSQQLQESIDALQRCIWLDYKSFAAAFFVKENTVAVWSSKGLLPVKRFQSKPFVHVPTFLEHMQQEPWIDKYQRTSEEVSLNQEAETIIEEHMRGGDECEFK